MSELNLDSFLKSLISTAGLSGYEEPVRKLISQTWQPLAESLSITPLGSLHALKPGTAQAPRPKILLAAHMDAIGLMVTSIKDGFLHVTAIGGIDPRILPGQPVCVHGKQNLPGIIVQPAGNLLPADIQDNPVPLEWLLVDTGYEAQQVKEWVKPGDLVSFDSSPICMGEHLISGHSLDDRASIAALTVCLHELQHMQHAWDVIAAATVQEEETFGGAYTSSYDVLPDIAVAIDVTFAKSPGVSDYNTFPLGKGVALGFGPNIHPAIFNAFKELCVQLDIPYHTDVMPAHSGTDAYALQVAAEGIPTMVISIPLRYMHTPVETVDKRDIQRAGHLLAEFIGNLKSDFISNITWDK